jgi:hypothetical protein
MEPVREDGFLNSVNYRSHSAFVPSGEESNNLSFIPHAFETFDSKLCEYPIV